VNDPRLSIDPDFKDAVWPLDKAKFSIALQEIIANALAYGRGKPVEILFNGEELRIRDHGRGIPKDSLIEIFGLFRRATTESTGAGIGLAITKQIVFAHGYRIWAQSAGDDQGSTFIIDFTPETPVQEQEASQRV
jgi:two-component system sensor histidine kinase VicK